MSAIQQILAALGLTSLPPPPPGVGQLGLTGNLTTRHVMPPRSFGNVTGTPPPPPPPPAPPQIYVAQNLTGRGVQSPKSYGTVAVPVSAAVRVGMNLPRPDYWTGDPIFRDLVRNAAVFEVFAGGSTCPINVSDGFPTQDFRLTLGDSAAGDCLGRVGGSFSTLVYTGDGTVSIGSWDAGTNTQTFTLHRNSAEFGILVFGGTKRLSTDSPGTGVRELIVLRPGETDFSTVHTAPFYPPYLAFCANFNGAVRFMDWISVNNTYDVRDVGNRPTATTTRTSFTYANSTTANNLDFRGYPEEDAIIFANAAAKNAHVCVPLGATDAYVADMATRWLTGLSPGLQMDVEYANELWNNGTWVTYGIRVYVCRLLDGFFDSHESGGTDYENIRLASCTSDGTSMTLGFNGPHNRIVGNPVYINGLDADNPFTGTAHVTAVPNANTITIDVSGHTAGSIRNNSSFTMIGKLDTATHSITYDGHTNVYELGRRWAQRRLCEISDIWRTAASSIGASFNGDNSRVRMLWAHQASTNDGAYELLDFYNMMTASGGRAVGGTAGYLWGIAGAHYCGPNDTDMNNVNGNWNNDTTHPHTEAEYAAYIDSCINDWINGYSVTESRTAWAKHFGMVQTSYEGGTDIFGDAGSSNNANKQAAVFDASLMQSSWRKLLNRFFAQGGVEFRWYTGAVRIDGSWSVATSVTDTTTAKIAAIRDVITAGAPTITRNVVAPGTVLDARRMADMWLTSDPPADPTLNTVNLHCGFFDANTKRWLLYSPIAQTVNMTVHHTCNFAQTAQFNLNGSNVGSLVSFSDVPANHTTVKALSPISLALVAGFNSLFVLPTSPGQGDDVHLIDLTF